MDSTIGFSYSSSNLAPMIIQVVAWVVVVAACLAAVRRPWARPGLAGGLLGLAVAVTYLADELKIRSDIGSPSAFILGGDDVPGFVQDRDLDSLLALAQTTSLVLLAMAFVTGAVLTRRAQPSRQA